MPVTPKAIWRARLHELQRMEQTPMAPQRPPTPLPAWISHQSIQDPMNHYLEIRVIRGYLPLCISWRYPMPLLCWMPIWQHGEKKKKEKVERTSRWNGDLDINFVHTWTPETSEPARVSTPNKVPAMSGVRITNAPCGIIFSGWGISGNLDTSCVVWFCPGIVLKCLRTSSTILRAMLPTLFIVVDENQHGSMAPTMSPTKAFGVNKLTVSMPAWLTKALNSARETTAADLIANPWEKIAVSQKEVLVKDNW